MLPLDKLIKLKEGILAYKVNNNQHLLGNFSLMAPLIDITNIKNYEDLRIPLHATTDTHQLRRSSSPVSYQQKVLITFEPLNLSSLTWEVESRFEVEV